MRRSLPGIEQFIEGIRSSDRVVLGQAITLVESARPEHQAMAREIIARLLPALPQNTFRIGITGAPGVGKSTLIEALGMHLTGLGKRVAVLAIDPSSTVSQGSILGDKTRMERLSANPDAFIRPSPAGDSLGGVAHKTRETILLAEAAGYDTVLVETVGVGQSETAVHRMTDVFLLLLLPGAGDELQGIKRGIVEMADLLVVNKADGERLNLASQARAHYLNALRYLPAAASNWRPRVLACSAQDNTGIAELWEVLTAYRQHTLQTGYFTEKRRLQSQYWFEEALHAGLKAAFYSQPGMLAQFAALQQQVLEGKISPFQAAQELLEKYR